MSPSTHRLGLLGGTFDPIHNGHVDAAEAARHALSLDELWLIPSHVPPHRAQQPTAAPGHRLAMTALVAAEHPGYVASDIELARNGVTYTSDTLAAVRALGWTPSQIFFILGSDAFAEIATWHAYPRVLDTAHFVIIARPGTSIDAAVARTPDLRSRVSTLPVTDDFGEKTRIFLVPAATRDVSSTQVRARLSTEQSLDGLVPPEVERYILTHHLYQAVTNLHGQVAGFTN